MVQYDFFHRRLETFPLQTPIRCHLGWFPPTKWTHNSTSFICNICLEPPAPTPAQHPGNRPLTTHNQPLQHNSALVLHWLSLHPPSLRPLLKALVKRADLLTAGRTPTVGLTTDQSRTVESLGFHSLAEIVAQQHWPIWLGNGLSNGASWLQSGHSSCYHGPGVSAFSQPKCYHSTYWLSFHLSILVTRCINTVGDHKWGIFLSEGQQSQHNDWDQTRIHPH